LQNNGRHKNVIHQSTSTANAASRVLGKRARTGLLPVRAFLFFFFDASAFERTPVRWWSFA
jgi:hypothetical protein